MSPPPARLLRSALDSDPMEQLRAWLRDAVRADTDEPHAMTLATVGLDGLPSTRVVLLKGVTPEGLVFFTETGSRKQAELDCHPVACLHFAWLKLDRQVAFRGRVRPLPPLEGLRWLAPGRDTTTTAWNQLQSLFRTTRTLAAMTLENIGKKLGAGQLPTPPEWLAYELRPISVEFWQGRGGRSHDRFEYQRPHHDPPSSWTLHELP